MKHTHTHTHTHTQSYLSIYLKYRRRIYAYIYVNRLTQHPCFCVSPSLLLSSGVCSLACSQVCKHTRHLLERKAKGDASLNAQGQVSSPGVCFAFFDCRLIFSLSPSLYMYTYVCVCVRTRFAHTNKYLDPIYKSLKADKLEAACKQVKTLDSGKTVIKAKQVKKKKQGIKVYVYMCLYVCACVCVWSQSYTLIENTGCDL